MIREEMLNPSDSLLFLSQSLDKLIVLFDLSRCWEV